MKKFFAAMIFSLFLFVTCNAQSGVKYIDAQLDANKLSEANADLSQVEIDFCDKPGEKEIAYTLAPGWNQDICLKANNASNKDIEVTIWFVDGTVTNDQRKNKACMQQGEDKNFWQYVTWFESSFIIPANDFVYQHAKFILPKLATWIVNWCLVFYTKSVEMWGNLNFSVLMRKAKFIDVQIKSKVESRKSKVIWWFIGIILLLLFFRNFNKPKKLPKR